MKIEMSNLSNFEGKKVWICHYNRPDILKRPIRNIPPSQVKVVSCSEVDVKVYYSDYCFKKITKNGLSNKVIQPYDVTGFRGRTGNPVSVFDNKEECISEWNSQLDYVKKKIEIAKENCQLKWAAEYSALEEMVARDER